MIAIGNKSSQKCQCSSSFFLCFDSSLFSNILKDLHHEHIVRYHDRHVDREAGILYILMEYCGGGDLSTVIKQAQKHNRPVPEDTIWNYFMQILLALNYCHHPGSHGRTGSGTEGDAREKRPQILHRDLKPDNGVLFLDVIFFLKPTFYL